MKQRYIHNDSPNKLSVETAEKLPTHRLLAYYNKLARGVFTWRGEFLEDCDCEQCTEGLDEYKVFEKYRMQIKAILDTREHVK